MKRSHFINSILTLTGTAFVYGCKNESEDILFNDASGSYSSPTVDGSKGWFSGDYIGSFANSRTQKLSVSRKLNWDKSQKIKSGKHDFVWVPIEYDENQKGTALLMWKEGEEYIQKLAQYLSWSINEGFLVYCKPNGKYDGFLAQIAFDPARNAPEQPIDAANFTGLVINADWNENILRSWRFLEGKMVSYNNPDAKPVTTKTARVQDCITYYTQYSTVTGSSCGMNCTAVTYTLHTVPHNVCDGSGSDSNYTGSGGIDYGDWFGYGPGGSGGGTTPPRPPAITNHQQLATNSDSWERIEFNKRLTDIMSAVGVGASVTDLTLAKATTIANALSLSNTGVRATFVNSFVIGSKAVGGIGVVTSAYSVAIGYYGDGEMNWWGQDGLNAVALAAGAVAVLTNPVGWWLIGLTAASSGISVGIAIYDANYPPL